MTCSRLYWAPPLPVRITNFVSDCSYVVYDALAVAKDGLEYLFLVLMWSKVQVLRA